MRNQQTVLENTHESMPSASHDSDIAKKNVESLISRDLIKLQQKLSLAEQSLLNGMPTVSICEARKRLNAKYARSI